MRRLILSFLLLAPLFHPLAATAQTQAQLCQGLRRLVEAAPTSFQRLSGPPQQIPGSVEEFRANARFGSLQIPAYTAVMQRGPSRLPPSPASERFSQLQNEVGTCLASAQVGPMQTVSGGVRQVWTLPRALVMLQRLDGTGGETRSEVQLSVGPRQ
ncbi:hypothetical protein [Falsiroseomonas sp. HW251]|uniref:hypothetical protein n=1 Tax=Falsiroseomonas sp. HW251 TaxID=3390998 RepID=UPI003D31B6AF